LPEFKEDENKDLDFWFTVTGFWLKERKTRNNKPETKSS